MFLISFLLVFLTAYFVTSIVCNGSEKRKISGFLILLVSIFANVILTMEILSVFSAISRINVLILNILFSCAAGFFWLKKGKPLYKPEFKRTAERIFHALKKDKILMIMAFGFLFFICVTLFLNIFMPVTSSDALAYHLNRAAFWSFQGSLNHFDIADDRNLVMPINSEILYMWILLFVKSDIGLNFVSFFGYIASIFSIYNILSFLGFCERKKIWTIFILSSFASVIAEVSSLETDVLIAGLVLTAITLFINYLKDKKLMFLYFAALSYAIAAGTKSPAIIAFPGVFLLLSFFAYQKEKKNCLKTLGIFLGFLIINFVIFSSYNYILNFIQYQDFLGSESAKAIHGFRGGIKAFVANYIRYIFMMFDFSGFRYSEYVGEYITNAKLSLLGFLHIPENLGVEMSDNNVINNGLLDVKMGTGLLGFLLFLPSTIAAIVVAAVRKIQNKLSTKSLAIFAFGLMFYINIFCLSFSIAYMVFSVRFMTFIVLLSAPVLVLSYMKKTNLLKLLILFFVMSYFVVITPNLISRPIKNIIRIIKEEKSISAARDRIRCALLVGYRGKMSFCYLRDMIKQTPAGTSFGIFPSADSRMFVVKMLENDGYKIDTMLVEKMEGYDFSKYDYIITTNKNLISTVLINKTKDTKINYKINKKGEAYFDKPYPYTCIYIQEHTSYIYNPLDKNSRIIGSTCNVPDSYFEKKGFDMIQNINFKSNIRENTNYMTIYKKRDKIQK